MLEDELPVPLAPVLADALPVPHHPMLEDELPVPLSPVLADALPVPHPPVLEEKKKRKTKEEKNREKAEKRTEKIAAKYHVKPGCKGTCRRNPPCSSIFSEEERHAIHDMYWSLGYAGQKSFILEKVTRRSTCHREAKPKIPRIATQQELENDMNNPPKTIESNKNFSYTYRHFKQDTLQYVVVCKGFFLETLGFKKECDSIITKTFSAVENPDTSPCVDMRGKHLLRPAPVSSKVIKDFIETYNPQVSHYAREKTPQRRYLPKEITVKLMYKSFLVSNPVKNVSYSFFLSVFKSMKISITQLGNEECEKCEQYQLHQKGCNCIDVCNVDGCLQEYLTHINKAITARKEYKNDKEKPKTNEDIALSVDLQKVILLPRINTFKSVIFTPRLVVFNETFAELGNTGTDTAIIWHEALSGRQDEDITSAFYVFITKLQGVKTLTLWLDNCGAQNKCWKLYTMLLYIVNCEEYDVDEIHLKYFIPGHSFMSADSVHGRIESQMRKKKNIYDFRDFTDCVENASCEAIPMEVEDFCDWQSGTTQYRLKSLKDQRPYMAEIVNARFVKGSNMLHFKTSWDGEDRAADFLVKKFKLSKAKGKAKKGPRGISSSKYDRIMEDIVNKLLPANRKKFWRELPVCDDSTDLLL